MTNHFYFLNVSRIPLKNEKLFIIIFRFERGFDVNLLKLFLAIWQISQKIIQEENTTIRRLMS